jgi:nucleoside-diphosphate-sugar epimerase
MNILITGGDGFIAKNLKNKLSCCNITSINREDLDLTDIYKTAVFFRGRKFDAVIHTAAVGVSTPTHDNVDILDQNLSMYYSLLQNRKHFNKFINLGSGAEIHGRAYPYGLSKAIIRESLLQKQEFYNIRIYAVFGSEELNTRFIKANILRYVDKQPMIINQNKRMDFFYIDDLTSLIRRYIYEESLPKEIDCTYNQTLKLTDIAGIINSLNSYKVCININKDGMDNDYCGIYNDIIENTNLINLQRGIQNIYNDICKNKK